jgi:hypothetical protein
MKKTVTRKTTQTPSPVADYSGLVGGISELLQSARRASARAVNSIMTAVYWETGRRIVEFEQGGEKRAGYGEELLARLAKDLTTRFGRGFSRQNLQRFRQFYLSQPAKNICSTLSSKLHESEIRQKLSGESIEKIRSTPLSIFQSGSEESAQPTFTLGDLAQVLPLPWSHYVLLISRARSPEAFAFYQTEALRGGWSVRQLQRQMDSQFYERTALSRSKAAMLAKAPYFPGPTYPGDKLVPKPASFFGSLDITPATAKVRLLAVAEEIISILNTDPNATVKVTLEIAAEFPNGASDQIKRSVSENASHLGFKNKSWEGS